MVKPTRYAPQSHDFNGAWQKVFPNQTKWSEDKLNRVHPRADETVQRVCDAMVSSEAWESDVDNMHQAQVSSGPNVVSSEIFGPPRAVTSANLCNKHREDTLACLETLRQLDPAIGLNSISTYRCPFDGIKKRDPA